MFVRADRKNGARGLSNNLVRCAAEEYVIHARPAMGRNYNQVCTLCLGNFNYLDKRFSHPYEGSCLDRRRNLFLYQLVQLFFT